MQQRTEQPRPIYHPRPDLSGNRLVARRTADMKVLELVPPRRRVWIVGSSRRTHAEVGR